MVYFDVSYLHLLNGPVITEYTVYISGFSDWLYESNDIGRYIELKNRALY